MGWWTTVEEGLANGLSWTWNNASLTGLVKNAFTYVTNTGFGIIEQASALKKAIPALYEKPKSKPNSDSKSWKIIKGMAYVIKGAIPLILLNYSNTMLQGYFRSEPSKDESWFTAYSVFLSGLTLVDYGVRAYTLRQGTETLIRVSILDTLGPIAFKKGKKPSDNSPCIEQKCGFSRKAKGLLKEPVILFSNDLLTGAISKIPHVGLPMSQVARVLFNGRYIARTASPLCERHKLESIRHETFLSLGLTYEMTSFLLDKLIQAAGVPYMYSRSLSHILLLLHVNLAANMELTMEKNEKQILPFDPLNVFEAVPRFLLDVLVAGLQVRIPLDFKFDETAEPLFTLTDAFKWGTKLANRDLDNKSAPESSLFHKAADKIWVFIAPPILQSVDDCIRDPIIMLYWPGLKKDVCLYVDGVLSAGYQVEKFKVAKFPGFTALALKWYKNVPIDCTETALSLSKDEAFWDLIYALKAWFDRHGDKVNVQLPLPSISLGEQPVIEPILNSNIEIKPIQSQTLLQRKPVVREFNPSDFSSSKKKDALTSINPNGFYAKRRQNQQASIEVLGMQSKG